MEKIQLEFCSEYYDLPGALVSVGLFPISPLRPRHAFCFGLLDFFEKVKIAVKASGQAITKSSKKKTAVFLKWLSYPHLNNSNSNV